MIYAFGPVHLKTVKLPCQQQFQRIAFFYLFFYLNGFGLIDRCVIWMNKPPFHFYVAVKMIMMRKVHLQIQSQVNLTESEPYGSPKFQS